MEMKNNLPLEPRSGSILVAVGFNPRSGANGITQFAGGEPNCVQITFKVTAG